MRRITAILFIICTVLMSACGGSDSSSDGAGNNNLLTHLDFNGEFEDDKGLVISLNPDDGTAKIIALGNSDFIDALAVDDLYMTSMYLDDDAQLFRGNVRLQKEPFSLDSQGNPISWWAPIETGGKAKIAGDELVVTDANGYKRHFNRVLDNSQQADQGDHQNSTGINALAVSSPTLLVPSNPAQKTCTNRVPTDNPALNTPFSVGQTTVSSLTFRTEMNTYFGEPTRRGTLKWEGTGGFSSLFWVAEVMNETGTAQYVTASGKRVFATWELGYWPGAGMGFGSDSTGSPGWYETFKTYNSANNNFENGVTEETAKNIFKTCHTLKNFRVLGISGTTFAKLAL